MQYKKVSESVKEIIMCMNEKEKEKKYG